MSADERPGELVRRAFAEGHITDRRRGRPKRNGDHPDPDDICVDWRTLGEGIEGTGDDYLIDDLWPKGRAISITADVKQGKSTLLFYAGHTLARGIDPWTHQLREPLRVGYLDYEMTQPDLVERLEASGVDPDHLDNFRYVLNPRAHFAPLDTLAGGGTLVGWAMAERLDVLAVDSISKVIGDEENSPDTFSNLARHTTLPLLHRGVSVGFADHLGHQHKTRARGSSAKGADVSVAWVMKRQEANNVRLDHNGITRHAWIPKILDLIYLDDPEAFRRAAEPGYPPGTADLTALLDQADVALNASANEANTALRRTGSRGKRKGDVLAALRYRRNRLHDTAS